MISFLKNKYFIINILLGIIPLIGVLFLGWSALDVFVLFILELLILGGFTSLKILLSHNPNGGKWSSLFIFFLLFPIGFLFIFILLGNFFDGSNHQMNYSISNSSIYFLFGVYTFNFIYFYLIKGENKRTTAKNLLENTFMKMGAIFLILLAILLPIYKFVPTDYMSVLMGVSILICRLVVDNFIDKRLQKSKTTT